MLLFVVVFMLGLIRLISILTTLFIVSSPLARQQPLTFAAIDYPPFYGESLPDNGPMIHIIRRAFQLSGFKVNVVFIPWVRAMMWSKDGEIDGIIGAWKTEERHQHFIFSSAIYPNTTVFYKRKDHPIQYTRFADLKEQGYLLGSVLGYGQPAGMVESGIEIIYVTQDTQPFKLLSKGRVDLIVVDKDYAKHVLIQPTFATVAQNIEPMDKVIERKQQYLMISLATNLPHKKMAAFQQGLLQLCNSGELNDILTAHQLSPEHAPLLSSDLPCLSDH